MSRSKLVSTRRSTVLSLPLSVRVPCHYSMSNQKSFWKSFFNECPNAYSLVVCLQIEIHEYLQKCQICRCLGELCNMFINFKNNLSSLSVEKSRMWKIYFKPRFWISIPFLVALIGATTLDLTTLNIINIFVSFCPSLCQQQDLDSCPWL